MAVRVLKNLFTRNYIKMSVAMGNQLHNDASGPNSFVEGVVCKESDLAENEMKVFEVGGENGGRVLLVKQSGKISAVGTRCSHYGAPLVQGALGDGRVRCPWHGACFSLATGDIEDFPGLDSIPCYNVSIQQNGDVVVKGRKSDLEANKRLRDMAAPDPANKNTFVIIGGGAAGECCVETLRQEGFSGRIVLITEDLYLPYDRIKLSKQLDVTADKIRLRSDGFYKEHGIEVLVNSKVVGVDTAAKKVNLENGTSVVYNSLFIATGSTPRHADLPGAELKNIFTLRSLSDASTISKSLTPETNVVIYGSSFIGMEAAAYCVSRVKSVTVVGRSAVPFKESLGQAVGERIAKIFSDRGVVFELGKTIKEFKGDEQVKEVVLSDGSTVPANVVILGLGAVPATQFLKGTAVNLTDRGFIPVNQFLETSVPGVLAGGDVAEAPVLAADGKSLAIGHWQLAHYHGRVAALNMLSKSRPLQTVPFFWTVLFGTSFRYAGHAHNYDDVLIGGSLDEVKFAAYYCKGDKILAVCTAGTDPIAAQFAEALAQQKVPPKSHVQNHLLDWYKHPY